MYESEFYTEEEAKSLQGWAMHMEPGITFPNEVGLKLLATIIHLYDENKEWSENG